jgi:hypothetical protein
MLYKALDRSVTVPFQPCDYFGLLCEGRNNIHYMKFLAGQKPEIWEQQCKTSHHAYHCSRAKRNSVVSVIHTGLVVRKLQRKSRNTYFRCDPMHAQQFIHSSEPAVSSTSSWPKQTADVSSLTKSTVPAICAKLFMFLPNSNSRLSYAPHDNIASALPSWYNRG